MLRRDLTRTLRDRAMDPNGHQRKQKRLQKFLNNSNDQSKIEYSQSSMLLWLFFSVRGVLVSALLTG